jgi:aspartokinase/homoserine dehydrogenase 1
MNKNVAYKATIKEIEAKHLQAIKALLPTDKGILKDVTSALDELKQLYYGVYLTGEFSLRTKDLVMSFGERLSCKLVNSYLNKQKLKSEFCDAREIIKTSDQFGDAKVDFTSTNKNIKSYFQEKKSITVVTGFIASNKAGVTTTLGRGGSDYTAAIIGAALGADEIQIWTDVNGVMSADPNKVKKAITLSHLTYNEAMEMCYFGAKVIHPPTIVPALEKNIPLRIKNTFAPEHEGTLIAKKVVKSSHTVKGITSIENINMLTLQGSGMVGVAGISARLFSALAAEKVNVILITQASSEHNISFAVKPEDAFRSKQAIEEEFELEIKSRLIEPVNIQTELSILAVIGENMKNASGVSGRLYQTLGKNGVSVIAAAQGSSELNISSVIKKEQLSKALNAVHDAFFLSDYKTINVYIAGVGLIGSKLIEQLNDSFERLKKQNNLLLHIAGFADSKQMYFSTEQSVSKNPKNILKEKGQPLNEKKFADTIFEQALSNSIFVDCTGNENWSKYYQTILENSISIVTPNKTAASGSQNKYDELKFAATKHNVKYLYETNVGAGLPVISTLNNLLLSGDEIIKIEAVLSGTLSFIFNTFNSSLPFSEVVKTAKEKGYTEPDPRDDLNGKDFARKLLILARECGVKMEMADVTIENILPSDCIKAKSVADFFAALKKHDNHFKVIAEKAEKSGKVLRMIGVFEKGKASLALHAVDSKHPFYNLSGSDNIISFTTNRYKERPLVVKGPGAGAEVTAAGVLADIINVSNYLA